MEESAPKRRRTSPRTSLNVGATEEPASPQRRRPSYASPTKASMSRNNPEAFERRRSRSPQKLPSARASGQFTFDSPSEALAARLATSRIVSDAPTPTRPEDTTPGSIRRVGGGMASAARRTSSRAGVSAEEDDFNPFRGKVLRRSPQAGIRMDVDAPSASMPQPELPPASMPEPQLGLPSDEPMEEPEENTPIQSEELAPAEETSPAKSPSAARSPSPARSFSSYDLEIPARSSSPIRSPSPAQAAAAPEPEAEEEPDGEPEQGVEPEAEPEQESVSDLETEPQPDPEPERDSPSPPPPLPDFSSSPPPASMPPPKIPPLVQPNSQDAAPSVSQPVPRLPPRDTGPRKSFQNSPVRFREFSQQRDSPLGKPPSRLLEKPRKSFAQAGSALREPPPVQTNAPEARQPRAFDPDAEKKKERDRVQKEIESLKKDLEIARKENERIRLMQQSGRILAPTNQDEVISLIERHLMSTGTEQSKTASQQLLQAALNPAALLPFSKPTAPAVRPIEEKQPDIKSHHPVAMTAIEELPYLELFTPFSMTSNTSILPEAEGEPLRQHYSITLRSREIPGIFTAKIEMTVNATELTVLDLDVTALEPAAKSELGPFIRKICTGDCNRSMQRNIGILSWAMGEWLRVALDRAGFWCQLEQSLGSKDGVSEAAARMRSKKHRRRRDSGEDSDEDEPTQVESVKKADLIRYLGQQHFDISVPYGDAEESGATVRLGWKTEFDWTGEAQTRLSVLVGAPGKWHQTDERGSLAKIPKLFEELVHGHEEPETAVRTIVALIAGEQS
ncbi:uncharacterized protein FTJAE_1777 [Fusarium tjaetaba]|uniref:Uncharacterized protein n=1 Tax=Fusarium tjaetaba TaxID=1567544 RepID=A0A8H5W6P3_9HYPO|nr:uncharacterized protein FTJAE_1777 [Fusarium tjaetaba]KAF5647345.1 hypothetical protein FTJAE_1777 [Fusarium tjaetaba]